MPDFIMLFRGGTDPQKNFKNDRSWDAWMRALCQESTLISEGWCTDECYVVRGSSKSEANSGVGGPFDIVHGYLRVTCNSFNEARQLSLKCPILRINGAVELRQLTP